MKTSHPPTKHGLRNPSLFARLTKILAILVVSATGNYLILSSHAATAPARHVGGSFQINVDDGAGKIVNVAYDVIVPSSVTSSAAPVVVTTNPYNATWQPAAAKYGFIIVNFRGLHNGTFFPAVIATGGAGPHTCGPSGTSLCDDIPYVQTVLTDLLGCHPVAPANTCSMNGSTIPYENIDATKLYSVGDSTGGAMVEGIMCDTRTSSLISAYLVSSAHLISPSTANNQAVLPLCPALGTNGTTIRSTPLNKTSSVLWLYSSTNDNCVAQSGIQDCEGAGFKDVNNRWQFGDDQLATTVLGTQISSYPTTSCTIPVIDQSPAGAGAVNPKLIYTVYNDTAGSNGYCIGNHHRVTATINAGAGSWHMPDTNNNIKPNPPYGYGGLNLGDLGWKFFTTYGGNSGGTTTPPPQPPAPTASLHASPSSVTSGSASTLTWSSSNATTCTASGGWSGSKALSGSASTGALSSTTTYTLSCNGAGGTAAANTSVTVNQSPSAVPTVSLSANPKTIQAGSASTLTWSSANATSCTASGGWAGAKPLSGSSSTGNLSVSTTYTLSCSGVGGAVSANVLVTATQAPPVAIGGGSSQDPPPVVTGTVVLTTTVPSAHVTYMVDNKPLSSAKLDTTQLSDGEHIISAQVTEPNGQVVTEKKTIDVNNHQGFVENAILRYGRTAVVGSVSTLSLCLVAVAVWLLFWRPSRLHFISPTGINEKAVLSSNQVTHSAALPLQAPGTMIHPDHIESPDHK